MKKLKYILSFAVLTSFILISCEDYLTKEIPFEELGYTPSLVLNAKVSSTTDTLLISVSKNINYADADRSEFELIQDVDVKLTFDGSQVFVAEPYNPGSGPYGNPNPYNYIIIFESVELSGKSFKLEANHPDYPSISSEIFLPAASELVSISYEKDAVEKVLFGYPISYDKVSVTLKDNPDDRNFYAFSVGTTSFLDTIISDYGGQVDTFIYENFGNQYATTSDDLNATTLGNFNYKVLFDDRNFNGEEYTFEILFEAWGGGNYADNLVLDYFNISEADFFFTQSYAKYQDAQDFGIFSEPVTLYSNIDGGLGVFSGEDQIEIPVE
ncbi:DUF4249 domain-containing protein [Saprospiraceae bacterium]|nr:DUF4249 domain-containing protein [Saprospiraceae bacterium]